MIGKRFLLGELLLLLSLISRHTNPVGYSGGDTIRNKLLTMTLFSSSRLTLHKVEMISYIDTVSSLLLTVTLFQIINGLIVSNMVFNIIYGESCNSGH